MEAKRLCPGNSIIFGFVKDWRERQEMEDVNIPPGVAAFDYLSQRMQGLPPEEREKLVVQIETEAELIANGRCSELRSSESLALLLCCMAQTLGHKEFI